MIEHGYTILVMAAIFGFFMAWAIGANDVANAMGIAVGSNILSLRQAIIVASIFEALGSILASGNVTSTISHGIVKVSAFEAHPHLLISGMLSALLASGVWLFIASIKGWPVSTTHTIIGAVFGFGWVCVGLENIYWESILSIFSSWILTPLFSGIVSYFLFRLVKKTIFEKEKPAKAAKRTVPYYVFLVVNIISSVIFFGSIDTLHLQLSTHTSMAIILTISLIAALLSYFWLRRIALHKAKRSLKDSYFLVEKVFGTLAIVTSCAMAFAHGSNDVANAIAPLAAIASIVDTESATAANALIPGWIFFLGAFGIVLGVTTYGYKVIATVGKGITDLTPTRGFVAQLATASIVVISSGLGMPVSTTHILVGSVLGVGMARGIEAININVVRNIFLSWFVTFPVGMLLAMIFFKIISFFIY
ncbi:MAG: inorganic phosphate transporter [Pseudomonadota bacterium]|nr:inorganic phosphate transporter [Pseudomonadota bacterium]